MKYCFSIEVHANSTRGVMDALWQVWEAFRDNVVPLSGNGSCKINGSDFQYYVKSLPQFEGQEGIDILKDR